MSAEAADGVPAGKYTVGLGQTAMAVCDANEDAVTLGMTGKPNGAAL